jgi:hypothetical protein
MKCLSTALLALALLGGVATASAQTQGAPPAYRGLVDTAIEESGAGRWAEARALFRQAHALYPNARTLRGIGMSSFEVRDYAECIRMLSASLAHPVNPLTEEQRAQVNELLLRARSYVATYTFEAAEGVTLTVDGQPVTRESDGSILVGLGTHAVIARTTEGRVVQTQLEVRGGETGALPIDLSPLTPEVVAALPEPLVPIPPTPPPPREAPVGSFVLLGVGGAFLVGGALALGLGLADSDAVANATPGTRWSSLREAYDRAPVLEGLGGALLGVGAALAVTGVVWLTLESTEAARVDVAASLTGFEVRGVW